MATKNKIIKLISVLLIISMTTPAILFSKPKQAEALSASSPGGAGISPDLPCILGPGIIPSPTKVPVSDSVAQGYLCTIAAVDSVNTGISFWENIFEYVIRETIKLVAKRILAQMTQAIINWINSDFHGAPLFLENPGSFFRDIAKSEVRNIVDAIGYDTLRFPFGRQVALEVIDSYKRQFEINAQYTLSKVENNPDLLRRYRNNFDFGGWNGFLINTQYPQNNYLGFRMMVEENLASKLQGTIMAPAQKIKDVLQQGMGFLSPQTCPSNPNYNNGFNEFKRPSFQYPPFEPPPACQGCTNEEQQNAENEAYRKYKEERDTAEAEWTEANTCPGGLVSTTPGSVAANQVMMALGSPLRSLELDAALGNSVAAIFDALINHFFDKGLNALADFVNPPPSFNDNWSYNGISLGDDGISTPEDLKIGQQPGAVSVSVEVGETTSERISGGDGNYSIKKSDEADKKIVLDERNKTGKTIAIVKINISGNSGSKLEITGVKKGNGAFTVEDSSNPKQSVSVNVTVGNVGDLLVENSNPASILIEAGSQVAAKISGGEKPYSLQQGADGNIAVAHIVDNELLVIGIRDGRTSVKIEDSFDKSVVVEITVGPNYLIITPSSILVTVDQTTSATISGGAEYYTVQPQSGESRAIAIAEILPDKPTTLTIRGIAPGTTTVTIQDSSNPTKTADITIETLEAAPIE